MRSVACLPGAQAYKSLAQTLLDLTPGSTVLDAGCGPGTDLAALLGAVGREGRVIGVDRDPAMLSRAREVGDDIELVRCDIQHLSLLDGSVDRVKTDRVLQHVDDPRAALAELHRVCRTGAIAVVCEPDWGTMVVDSPDPAASDAFTLFTCERVVRNATLGRQIGRLASEVGWTRDTVVAVATTFDDFEIADRVLALGRNSQRAVDAGYLSEAQRARWLADLVQGPMYAAASVVVTRFTKPRG